MPTSSEKYREDNKAGSPSGFHTSSILGFCLSESKKNHQEVRPVCWFDVYMDNIIAVNTDEEQISHHQLA